ncbi:hypothetical protein HMPREF2565_05215 [Corynebacterium sp. HMSC072A04]|nr:hypothetical protein HMPREF2565_05215 [Corynebacterium sp. HMSC072A04]
MDNFTNAMAPCRVSKLHRSQNVRLTVVYGILDRLTHINLRCQVVDNLRRVLRKQLIIVNGTDVAFNYVDITVLSSRFKVDQTAGGQVV